VMAGDGICKDGSANHPYSGLICKSPLGGTAGLAALTVAVEPPLKINTVVVSRRRVWQSHREDAGSQQSSWHGRSASAHLGAIGDEDHAHESND
jgi:hypothetical protein